jgi:hypothetical protein
MRPSAPLLPVLLLAAACSTPAPKSAAPTATELARAALQPEVRALSAKAEALLRAQDELVWKSWTEGAPADLAKTYAGTEAWLTPAAIASVERLRGLTTDAGERRALAHLHAYLVTEWLAQNTVELSEAVAKLEQELTLGSGGQERPYRNLEALLAGERSALRRKALSESATPAVMRLSELLAQRRVRTEALVEHLGLSAPELVAELREASLDELLALANQVLDRTQSAFATTLARLSWTELQLPVERVTRADVPRLFRLQGPDAAFPSSEIYPRAIRTLEGLGIDLPAMQNVTVDLRTGPGKNPRGLVLGVVVPTDVRVSLLPVGGVRDQRETLHQMGHTLHDALTRERRWELAKLGNRTVAEAWSFLLEDLALDPLWLERVAGLSGEAQVAWRTSALAQRLFLLRRAAGKVLFNAALRAPGADPKATYGRIMTRVYGFPMTPADDERAELDREEFLASGDYLQAFLLSAQLAEALRMRCGPAWWQEKAAGDWVRGRLAPGTSLSAGELARALGGSGIGVDALLAALPPTLGGPMADGGTAPAPLSDAGATVPAPAWDGGSAAPAEAPVSAPPDAG